MKLDPGRLTFGELLEIEEKVGVSFGDMLAGGTPSMRAVVAMVWVLRRREEPGFSWEDALQLELSTADTMFADDPSGPSSNGDSPDPTPAAVESISG